MKNGITTIRNKWFLFYYIEGIGREGRKWLLFFFFFTLLDIKYRLNIKYSINSGNEPNLILKKRFELIFQIVVGIDFSDYFFFVLLKLCSGKKIRPSDKRCLDIKKPSRELFVFSLCVE